jgi:hypothetical protein
VTATLGDKSDTLSALVGGTECHVRPVTLSFFE